MLNHLENHFNKTITTNGALAYKSTKSDLLDLFAQGGAMRDKSDDEVIRMFSKAFAENATLAMKTLFYLRDIKGGQGERRFFKTALKYLATHQKDSLVKNLHLIPQFGRWDDLWVLLETDVVGDIAEIVNTQLINDMNSDNPSLLAKWMPSQNASSKETKKNATILIKYFETTPKKYRKILSHLRNKINLVETMMTEDRYEDIDYSKLPSKAGMQYRGAFFRNDEYRYKEFLDSLSKGETTVNAGTLYPSDIVSKILSGSHYSTTQDIKLYDGMWNNLPDFIGENKENSLVMADVSGSMGGTPLNVSIALAMYIAERNKGVYHNHFMTFSTKPELVSIKGNNIVEKVRNISRANWSMSTDIELALQTILDVAVENEVSVEEMVKKIYIISDMQFNSAIKGNATTIFKSMEKSFNHFGYEMPNIVFWNVRASENTQAKKEEAGVQLVSGYSPSILTQLLSSNGKTPYDFMIEVIDSERYAGIFA